MIEQCSSIERDDFYVPYLSDKIPKSVFHGQSVKTVGRVPALPAPDPAAARRVIERPEDKVTALLAEGLVGQELPDERVRGPVQSAA